MIRHAREVASAGEDQARVDEADRPAVARRELLRDDSAPAASRSHNRTRSNSGATGYRLEAIGAAELISGMYQIGTAGG